MDENLLSLLEELSLRSCSEDETHLRDGTTSLCSTHNSSSNVSSPNYEQLTSNLAEEDLELKSAVKSLFNDLGHNDDTTRIHQQGGYDKSKLLVALLGNVDLVTCAVKKINQLVSLGKKMEQIYRSYYQNPDVELNMDEINRLISEFSSIYNSESYVRQVNVSRVYQAYCMKLIEIQNQRTSMELN